MFDCKNAPSIPLQSPSYPKAPFTFYFREYFIVSYLSDPAAIKAGLPEPLEPDGSNIVLYEFMKMPDSPGFGSYTESGVIIPAKFNGVNVNFTSQMYLDCDPPIYGGREIWGFPKKRGKPILGVVEDTLLGTLEYGTQQVAMATMPYKAEPIMARHEKTPQMENELKSKLQKPQVNLKIIPGVDGSDDVRQLIQYNVDIINIHEAWKGPARLHLVPHVNAPVADFPIDQILGATHIIADLLLPYGKVIHDYLK